MTRGREHHDRVGSLLEHLPVKLKADLTFPTAVTEVDRDNAFDCWIANVQEQHRCTVGYIRGDEVDPYRHLHVVLVSHRDLDVGQVQQAWVEVLNELYREWPFDRQASIANAVVQLYARGAGGISYAGKSEGEAFCNVQYSPNLDLFSSMTRGRRQRPTTSRERRQARRIAAQRSSGRHEAVHSR